MPSFAWSLSGKADSGGCGMASLFEGLALRSVREGDSQLLRKHPRRGRCRRGDRGDHGTVESMDMEAATKANNVSCGQQYHVSCRAPDGG